MEKFTDFLSARRYAEQKQKEAKEQLPQAETPPSSRKRKSKPIAESAVDYFVHLQNEAWGKGRQDFRPYAGVVWKEIIGEDPDAHPDVFNRFVNEMVTRLHALETRLFVFPEVREALPKIIAEHGSRIRKVILWSTGDVSGTGYQIAKIDRLRIVTDFYKELQTTLGDKAEAKQFMREKTEYMVDDDKFGRLVEFVRARIADGYGSTKNPLRIVIIEDTKTNFTRVQHEIQAAFSGAHISIIPMWAMYSRYARIGRAMAENRGQLEQFAQEKTNLNGIDSFSELADSRFQERFQDAYVFVDFDGVIMDDDSRRVAQVAAVVDALYAAAARLRISRAKVLQKISDNVFSSER